MFSSLLEVCGRHVAADDDLQWNVSEQCAGFALGVRDVLLRTDEQLDPHNAGTGQADPTANHSLDPVQLVATACEKLGDATDGIGHRPHNVNSRATSTRPRRAASKPSRASVAPR